MSISLPNGTLLAAPSSSTVQYSAAVTRILHLANFSADLKTRDLQAMFREYESEKGGFRIKWLDDVNALVVFADALTAKKAYLAFLLHPPVQFQGQIRPYDKPDAAQIIQSLAARNLGHRGSASQAAGASFSLNGNGGGGNGTAPTLGSSLDGVSHNRTLSSSSGGGWGFPPPKPTTAARTSISNPSGPPNASARHHRTSSSTSGRQPLAGVLNFNSGGIGRLATHKEATTPTLPRSAASPANSSDTEPIISLDPPNLGSAMHGGWKMGGGGAAAAAGGGSNMTKARRESMSAEKALREVEKALAGGGVHA